jgi:hypothetical protein
MAVTTFIISIVTLITAIVAIFIASIIPKKIMANQLFADLVAEYRTPEMGGAILALFHFYDDCLKKKVAFDSEYERVYNIQLKQPLANGEKVDYVNTLHFQRRLVSQFYTDMADLCFERFDKKLFYKKLAIWFTDNEVQLLKIILHLAQPASNVFVKINNVPEPPEVEKPMYQAIHKLYTVVRKRIISSGAE